MEAQTVDTINVEEVRRIITYLASDSLKGRGNFTPELRIAADFIASEFERENLDFYPRSNSYLHPFTIRDQKNEKYPPPDSANQFDSLSTLYNVVAILPGKSKAGEAIIFSAHYDHIGIHTSGNHKIYNGANDNASGTTALLMLAKYYSLRDDNERTLIFIAFAGEELGLYGSEYFVKRVATDRVVAMVNIEMIGRASRKKRFFITGAYLSDLEKIIKKNLKGSDVHVTGEPDESKQLFRRSDNYHFARTGIPAHTIMSSDDSDACYHQVCDDVERLDLENMTQIIRAIARSLQTIVDGNDTPKRIQQSSIRY